MFITAVAKYRPAEIQLPYQCTALAASFIASPYSPKGPTSSDIYNRRKNKRRAGMPLTEALDLLQEDKLIKGYRKVCSLDELIGEVSSNPVILTLPVYDKMTDTFWKSPIHAHLPDEKVPFQLAHAVVFIHSNDNEFVMRNSWKNKTKNTVECHLMFPHADFKYILEAYSVQYFTSE